MQFLVRAHHEGGHAVAAYLLRIKLISVSTRDDETSVGRCLLDLHYDESINNIETVPAQFDGHWFDDWRVLLRRDYLERIAIVALAGEVAELRYSGLGFASDDPQDMGWGSDYQIAADCLRRIAEDWDDVEKHREWLKGSTERLIEANWRFVESVADGLREHQEMTWEDVDRIYKELA